MSSHFNYEINEVKLRERLCKMELSATEDAWLSFQNFSRANPVNQRKNVIPNFQLNINRNLVLPFVFGTVIIAFSFLLFNFVSIKKKPDVKLAEVNTIVPSPKPIEKKAKPAPAKKDSAVVPSTTTATVLPEPTPTLAVVTPTINANKTLTTSLAPAVTDQYSAVTGGNIYASPNKNSEVIGNFSAGKGFTPTEETVYFVKVSNGSVTGYVMKSQLHKRGTAATPVYAKKPKKAEVLQSNQTPFMTTSEEKEPELR